MTSARCPPRRSAAPAAAHRSGARAFGATQKGRPRAELLCDYGFRRLAHPLVLALARLRVPPPAVVMTHFGVGLAAAALLWRGQLIPAAALLQVKSLLDNADGQLARATGRVTDLGRYLDTELDLVANAAVFAALGHATGQPWLALAAFVSLTALLSVDFNLEPLYREARGEPRGTRHHGPAGASVPTLVLRRLYEIVFAPQDRLVERVVRTRLERLLARTDDSAARRSATLAYHDGTTLAVTVNLELTTQLAVLGACLALGLPVAYLWFVVGCLALLPLLQLRRERRARRALQA